MSQHDTLTLEQALKELLANGGAIAEASDKDLQEAIDDPHAEEIIKAQAAAILKARAALSATQPAHGMALVPEETLTPLQRTYLAQTLPAQAAQPSNRPTPEWYSCKIQETLDDDFVIGPGFVEEAQGAQGEPVVPPELDVRRIMLDIVPGDGDGLEVYAKNVDDVVEKLTEMAERIESLEGAQPAVAQGAGEVVAWVDVHDRTNLYYRKPPQGDVRPLTYADTQPAAGADVNDTACLDALARPGWELSMNNDPECFSNELWQVHRVSGGRNDREWTLIGKGADPRAAIRAAIAASERQP